MYFIFLLYLRMQKRIFHVKCVPAQQMSADKLYKRFRPSSGTKKFWGLIWIQTVPQDFQTSTPETTGSNELPISYGDSFW